MTTHPMNPIRSEQGIALVIVLLLLAVMAGLTTGLTLNGQTEIAMAHNEQYYAGTRAAAEAGMNRAIEQIIGDTTTDLIATKAIPNIGNGPIDLNDEYSYSFQILDDDDPILYNGVALTPDQLTAMGAGAAPENNDPDLDTNSRMIVRATAFGPRGTTVTVGRILSRFTIQAIPTVTVINPAILVNGNLDMNGSIVVGGTHGNVHANGNISGGANGVTGNVTATGEIADGIDPGGLKAGGMPEIPIPAISAANYESIATHKLTSAGTIQVKSGGAWVACGGKGGLACPTGWTFGGGTWSASGAMPSAPAPNKATYYVEGNVTVHGTGKGGGFTELSLIAEGNIKITGNGKFKPANGQKIQFVTNGDFELGGTADADDPIDMDGQIMVREQMKIYGNSEFQGRVMVENRDSNLNSCAVDPVVGCNRGASQFASNNLSGNMTVSYNGSLDGIEVPDPPGLPTYTNIISGWMEQQ